MKLWGMKFERLINNEMKNMWKMVLEPISEFPSIPVFS